MEKWQFNVPPESAFSSGLRTLVVASLVDGNSQPIIDGVSSDASPKMGGTGMAGDIISLYDSAIPLGSTRHIGALRANVFTFCGVRVYFNITATKR